MFHYSLKKVTAWSIGLMILTSLHHIYGAWVYNTPWRLHALMISVPVIIITALLHGKIKESNGRFFCWGYWVVTLVPSLSLIGIFEGIYNHVLKNILYFAGAGRSVLDKLYKPGVYEMPDDFLFEATGILQGVFVIPLIIHFARLTRLMFIRSQQPAS